MAKCLVWALKDEDTGLFWNRIHKDFRELSQNTAFMKTERLAIDSRDNCSDIRRKKMAGKNVIPVKILFDELYCVDEVIRKYLNGE